jgi:radical SAM protein with 4Fe4S-binding SPASM domain
MVSTDSMDRYVLPHEMHEFQRDDRFLFFDPVNFVWFQTDQLGKGVVDGLARGGTVRDAAEEVARLASAPVEDAEVYAARAIEQLIEIGFLQIGEYQRKEFSSGIAKVPFILYLHMTARCNLRCPYCYNQENRAELWHAPVGSYEQFTKVIDEAAELGFREVKLTGGEALLNKHTLPLARHARQRGLWVNLLTNGTLIDESNAREIVESVNTVSLSLDSAHPEEHDAVRGKDTWKKVLDAIRLLREAGLGYLHLNSVVTPVNKDSVEEFLEFAWEELKAQKVTLAPTGMDVSDPSGRWGAKQTMLSADDMWDVYEAQRAFRNRKAADHPPVVSRNDLRRTQCGVGNGLVSVDSNGDLYPCQTMHMPELRCGNVFETSLRQILDSSGLLQQARNLTVDRLEDCPTCPMRYVCSGGCRMEAYTREGRLEARNRDLCPLFFTRALEQLWMTANLPVEKAMTALGSGRETPLEFFESYS